LENKGSTIAEFVVIQFAVEFPAASKRMASAYLPALVLAAALLVFVFNATSIALSLNIPLYSRKKATSTILHV
jgi:hypothetical protein